MKKIKIEGRNSVIELLRSGTKFEKVCIEKNIKEDHKIKAILKLAKDKKVRISFVDKKRLNNIAETNSHQGVIAYVKDDREVNLNSLLQSGENDLFFLIVKEFCYGHNLGAILRTAECVGVTAVIVPKNSKITPDVHRVSMGASQMVPIIKESVFSVLKQLRDFGVRIIGIEVSGEQNYFDIKLNGNIALVVGGEDKGLSEEILKKCDEIVRIPMLGSITSLNMSVSIGVVMYERLRQQLSKN